MGDERGRIAFFSTYRPPVALDIYSCPYPPSNSTDVDERLLTDGGDDEKENSKSDPPEGDDSQLTDGGGKENSNSNPSEGDDSQLTAGGGKENSNSNPPEGDDSQLTVGGDEIENSNSNPREGDDSQLTVGGDEIENSNSSPRDGDDSRKTVGGKVEYYNCNAQVIPKQSLKFIIQIINNNITKYNENIEKLKKEFEAIRSSNSSSDTPDSSKLKMKSKFNVEDIDLGKLSGFVFVSERTGDLETLHFAICLNNNPPKTEHVFNFAELFSGINEISKGVRMEDSGCFAGEEWNYLVYVSTKDRAPHRRQPWTAVYKTCLKTGKTDRLTPLLQADLSPSVSPSGKKIAVASLQKRGGWYGEREKLKTDIFTMNIEKPYNRKLVIKDGGWPTWGSEDVIFFHRRIGDKPSKKGDKPFHTWGVYRTDFRNGETIRVTGENINAVTPAAINANLVAVATMRKTPELKSFTDNHQEEDQYRQIEIFDFNNDPKEDQSVKITAKIEPLADHFNPFIINGENGNGMRIGYNRCKKRGTLKSGEDDVPRLFDNVQSHHEDKIGLFRVSGVFPTFSSDGSKLAFIDNDFKSIWLADDKPLRKLFQENNNIVFSPVWSQSTDINGNDVLYACFGPAFNAKATVIICSISIDSVSGKLTRKNLNSEFNNAFPSTNQDGTKLVYRSTRDHHGHKDGYKNLYIMNDVTKGDDKENLIRLTEGEWTDTHCKWSPNNDWIVFTSNRNISKDERRPGDEDLDSGFFSIFLVNSVNTDVVRVMRSGNDLSGHVTHPFFSPDGRTIVVTSDIAAISADPMSLPLFLHSARPYGDIFTVDLIDLDDMSKNENIETYTRVTHTRYENATGTWTKSPADPAKWNDHIKTLPFFSSAPWLTTMEKFQATSNMSTAIVAMLAIFPLASVAILGYALYYIMERYINQRSKK